MNPKVSLVDAVAIAEASLNQNGDQWHALSAEIGGLADHDGKFAHWGIVFGCMDGRQKLVTVQIADRSVETVDWEVRTTFGNLRFVRLEDLRTRIANLIFGKLALSDAKHTTSGEMLDVSYQMRTYSIYPFVKDGIRSEDPIAVVAPSSKGFSIDTSVTPFRNDAAPYWETMIRSVVTPTRDQIWVRLRMGEALDRSIRQELVNLLYQLDE